MGLFDSIASIWNTERTNSQNAKNVKSANEANAALWREQSAYNTPAEQMKRLEAAGLNPNLAYGQIAESRASNAPAMQAPQAERANTSIDESISQYQQVKNMQTLNARNTIEIEKAKADAISAAATADYNVYATQKMKNEGSLKTDPAGVKIGGRIWDYLKDSLSTINKARDDGKNIPWRLLMHTGPDERAHTAVGDNFDGGQ